MAGKCDSLILIDNRAEVEVQVTPTKVYCSNENILNC